MRTFFIFLFFIAALMANAQQKTPKTAVFKVRASVSGCSIFPEDSVFWLEKPNKVRIKVTGDKKIKVVFRYGKIIAQDGDSYTVKFDTTGKTVISVYEVDGKKTKLLQTMLYRVMEPELFFCGVKVGTRSSYLKMRDKSFTAHSVPLDTMLSVTGFDMMFHDGVKYKTYHADNDMLSADMRKVIFEDYRFPANGKKQLFFSNIHAKMPDGKVKTLSPIALYVERDTTNRGDVVFHFIVKRMKLSGLPR